MVRSGEHLSVGTDRFLRSWLLLRILPHPGPLPLGEGEFFADSNENLRWHLLKWHQQN
jgi:hypothetical protein